MKEDCLTDREKQYFNERYKVEELLKQFFNINVFPGRSFRCPYHDDNHPSAKLYNDNSFYCFSCGKQYPPVSILFEAGYEVSQLRALVPDGWKGNTKASRESDFKGLEEFAEKTRRAFKENGDLRALMKEWVGFLKNREKGIE